LHILRHGVYSEHFVALVSVIHIALSDCLIHLVFSRPHLRNSRTYDTSCRLPVRPSVFSSVTNVLWLTYGKNYEKTVYTSN